MCEVPEHTEIEQLTAKPNKLRQGFIGLAETLLSSISDVFPECSDTQNTLQIFRSVVKGNDEFEDVFIRRCQVLFQQHAEKLAVKDAEALFSIVEGLDFLRDINLRDKWEDPDFAAESRDHLWQYVSALKTYADLYSSVPKEVMGKIENFAGKISQQLTDGELDLRNLDIGNIGQELMKNLSPEELEGFQGNLPQIFESLSEVANSMVPGSTGMDLTSLMQQIAQQTGEGDADSSHNGIDVTSILQQFSTQIRPNDNNSPTDVNQFLQTMGPMLQAMQASLPREETRSQPSQRKTARKRRTP